MKEAEGERGFLVPDRVAENDENGKNLISVFLSVAAGCVRDKDITGANTCHGENSNNPQAVEQRARVRPCSVKFLPPIGGPRLTE